MTDSAAKADLTTEASHSRLRYVLTAIALSLVAGVSAFGLHAGDVRADPDKMLGPIDLGGAGGSARIGSFRIGSFGGVRSVTSSQPIRPITSGFGRPNGFTNPSSVTQRSAPVAVPEMGNLGEVILVQKIASAFSADDVGSAVQGSGENTVDTDNGTTQDEEQCVEVDAPECSLDDETEEQREQRCRDERDECINELEEIKKRTLEGLHTQGKGIDSDEWRKGLLIEHMEKFNLCWEKYLECIKSPELKELERKLNQIKRDNLVGGDRPLAKAPRGGSSGGTQRDVPHRGKGKGKGPRKGSGHQQGGGTPPDSDSDQGPPPMHRDKTQSHTSPRRSSGSSDTPRSVNRVTMAPESSSDPDDEGSDDEGSDSDSGDEGTDSDSGDESTRDSSGAQESDSDENDCVNGRDARGNECDDEDEEQSEPTEDGDDTDEDAPATPSPMCAPDEYDPETGDECPDDVVLTPEQIERRDAERRALAEGIKTSRLKATSNPGPLDESCDDCPRMEFDRPDSGVVDPGLDPDGVDIPSGEYFGPDHIPTVNDVLIGPPRPGVN